MVLPTLDVFRFRDPPTKPFPYLGAMWIIETKEAASGDYWECATTAPVRMVLAMAESQAALHQELTEKGIAAIRNTTLWFLLQHLATLGVVEQIQVQRAEA